MKSFYLEKATLYISISDGLELNKNVLMSLFLKNTSFHIKYLMDWSGVDYLWVIMMFLSSVWTLILTAPIHCRASIGEQVM